MAHQSEATIKWRNIYHDDVMKWKYFPLYRPFVMESTGHRRTPLIKTNDPEYWCFLWSAPEQTVEQTIKSSVIWNAIALTIASLQCGSRWWSIPIGTLVPCMISDASWKYHQNLLTHHDCGQGTPYCVIELGQHCRARRFFSKLGKCWDLLSHSTQQIRLFWGCFDRQ